MNYAKLKNGVLVYAPVNYITPTGSLIVNFHKNAALMKKYGFKEVADNKPSYDDSTEYLTISGYIESEENIIINYKINEIEINKEISLEERVTELERINREQNELIQELLVSVNFKN